MIRRKFAIPYTPTNYIRYNNAQDIVNMSSNFVISIVPVALHLGILGAAQYRSETHVIPECRKISIAHNINFNCQIVLAFYAEHGSIMVSAGTDMIRFKKRVWTAMKLEELKGI